MPDARPADARQAEAPATDARHADTVPDARPAAARTAEDARPPGSDDAAIWTGKPCVAPADLAAAVAGLPRPLVFTNGVFDILHRGHVTYLAKARSLGASLVVALNADASVRRLGKGDDRPINTLADRLAVIAALAAVDMVTWFDDDTPLALIEAAKPDVLVKGGDWSVDRIVGADVVQALGGQVVSMAFDFERSTTSTLQRIRTPR